MITFDIDAQKGRQFKELYEAGLPSTVYALLCETAAKHPSAPAWHFIDEGLERTWHDVLGLVDKTADAFHSIGIHQGSHVAIMTNNIEEFPLTWFALAKLGAVFVPVNNGYTSDEIAYALRTADSDYFILEAEFVGRYEASAQKAVSDKNVVVIGGDTSSMYTDWAELIGGAHPPCTAGNVSPDTLLNIQFTSGTTGFSKGCLLTHEYWLVLGVTSCTIFGQTMQRIYVGQSFYYMVSQRIFMNALLYGACLIVPRKAGAKRFMQDVIDYECDYCSMFEMVYKHALSLSNKENKLKLVTIFAFGPENQRDFQSKFNVLAQEFYGMTEIGGALYVPVDQIPNIDASGSCGVATPFRELMICDESGEPVAEGHIGELCVRGPGIMLGYYKNPAANEAVFRHGWFRTGDLFRRDEHGFYRIVGRTKDMVRRNGENIAAQEVESVIRALPEVKQVAVIPVPDDYCGEEVKAYIQLNDGVSREALPIERIVEHCRSGLARFKVPRYYEYKDNFELTDSLRVKKKALVEEKTDLRAGSFDLKESIWR